MERNSYIDMTVKPSAKIGVNAEHPNTPGVNELLLVVPSIGLLISLAGLIGVLAAGRMHYIWTTQLNLLAGRLNKDDLNVSFGIKPHWPARSSCIIPIFIAFLFCVAWLFIIIKLRPYEASYILLGVAISILLLLVIINCITNRGERKTKAKAIIFDIDGVLLDTLGPHLEICADLNHKFDLKLEIPSAKEFKYEIVRKGCRISPMECFFRALGFQGAFLEKACKKYSSDFSSDYDLIQFDGVQESIKQIYNKGTPMGIVTSNNLSNIKCALEGIFQLFRGDCIFTLENNICKDEALKKIANILGLKAKDILYVGDQISDYNASQVAGTQFLGVSYGWGISYCDTKFDVVRNIDELLEYVT